MNEHVYARTVNFVCNEEVSNHPFAKFSLVSIFITVGSIGVFSVIPYGMTLNCNLVKGNKTRI